MHTPPRPPPGFFKIPFGLLPPSCSCWIFQGLLGKLIQFDISTSLFHDLRDRATSTRPGEQGVRAIRPRHGRSGSELGRRWGSLGRVSGLHSANRYHITGTPEGGGCTEIEQLYFIWRCLLELCLVLLMVCVLYLTVFKMCSL